MHPDKNTEWWTSLKIADNNDVVRDLITTKLKEDDNYAVAVKCGELVGMSTMTNVWIMKNRLNNDEDIRKVFLDPVKSKDVRMEGTFDVTASDIVSFRIPFRGTFDSIRKELETDNIYFQGANPANNKNLWTDHNPVSTNVIDTIKSLLGSDDVYIVGIAAIDLVNNRPRGMMILNKDYKNVRFQTPENYVDEQWLIDGTYNVERSTYIAFVKF